MPRIFSTKSRRRGTAWQAMTGGTIPTSPAKERSSVSSDPEFDYVEGNSQAMISSFNVRKVSAMKPGKEESLSDTTEPNAAAMDGTASKPDEATTTTSQNDQSIQNDAVKKVEAKETRVEELETELKIRQIAIEKKDGQIKIMARDLDEVKQERVSLKDRLAETESSLSIVMMKIEQLRKEFVEQKESLGASAQAAERRFLSLEKQILEGSEALKHLKSGRELITERSGDHEKAVGALTDRMVACEKQIAQLRANIELQNKQAADEREAFRNKLESIEKAMNNKNDKIHKLESFLQDSAKEAKQLKALLTKLSQKFASKEGSNKRMLEAKTHNTKTEHVPRNKTQKRSDHSVTDWLSKYES